MNFKNEAAEAITFYESVFDTKCNGKMTFGDAPENLGYPVPEAWKSLIMNASMEIEGVYVMFSDIPDGIDTELIMGNNISLVISTDDEAKIEQLFKRLSNGGKVTIPLGTTFWSKKYGVLIDKYGINWMLNVYQDS